ncbi:MAG: hypothetical protein ACM3VZ_06770 [Acidobacteriota bacterium]
MPIIDARLPSPTREPDPADTPSASASTLSAADRSKVEKAAVKFESMFIGEVLKQMRRTTSELADEDSVFKNKVNNDMLEIADTAVADALAGQRAFGVADAILRQLLPALAQPLPTPKGR